MAMSYDEVIYTRTSVKRQKLQYLNSLICTLKSYVKYLVCVLETIALVLMLLFFILTSQVQKVEVEYDKTSKQVDVQTLKETIWVHIQESPQMAAQVYIAFALCK